MILEPLVAAKQAALEELRRRPPRLEGTLPPLRSLVDRLRREAGAGVRVIAEFKRRSPSAGWLRPWRPGDVAEAAADYRRGGAAALSILTEGPHFAGGLADLAAARGATAGDGLPILRKDFLLIEEELVEARLAGADAVLLIARLLAPPRLGALLAAAGRLGLQVLVEVHSEGECDQALAAGATLVGVNHRDLDRLTIDLDLSARLAPRFPDGVVRVAESGLRSTDDLRAMADRGYDGVLVGERLLRHPSPGAALAALLDGSPCG